MTTAQTSEGFWSALEQCGLLTTEQCAAMRRFAQTNGVESTADVLKDLIRRGWLTPFQADRLREGRSRGFFFDQYKLVDLIALGGMGWVYQAVDTGTGEVVALKILREDLHPDQGLLARFQQEAKVGLRLNHPHIVQTLSLGSAGGWPYVTMEFVAGPNLLELLIKQRRLPWRQACEFARQAALGLSHAHHCGVIHRDIKPQNLLIDAQGRVRLLDFGLSMMQEGVTGDEFSLAMIFGHESVGTMEFAAPEQIADSLAADARSDIYSLGGTLYAMITGVNPWARSDGKVKPHQIIPSVSDLVPEVPAEVAEIVAKMVHEDSTQRYATADEVATALTAWAQPGPVMFDFAELLRLRKKDALRRLANISPSRAGAAGLDRSTARLVTTSSVTKASHPGKTRLPGDFPEPEQAASSLPGFIRNQVTPKPAPGERSGPVLVVLDSEQRIPLPHEGLVIGRSDDCGLQLFDAAVSSRHCELDYDGRRWRITDLDSRNGTFVNGRAVQSQTLRAGDELTIGTRQRFRLELPVDDRQVADLARFRRTAWILAALSVIIIAILLAWFVLQGR